MVFSETSVINSLCKVTLAELIALGHLSGIYNEIGSLWRN